MSFAFLYIHEIVTNIKPDQKCMSRIGPKLLFLTGEDKFEPFLEAGAQKIPPAAGVPLMKNHNQHHSVLLSLGKFRSSLNLMISIFFCKFYSP